MRRLFIVSIALVAALAGGGSAHPRHATSAPAVADSASSRVPCPVAPVVPFAETTGLAAGRGVWSAVAGSLTQQIGLPVRVEVDRGPGVIRHIATAPGIGTAYVRDRAGGDVLITITADGVERFPQRVEVSNPAWSSRGDLAWSVGTGILVRDAQTGEVRHLDSPKGASSVFSPVFSGAHRLVAVGSAGPTARIPEDERENNLWMRRLGGHMWHRLTSFRSHGDRWIAIRTPVARAGGAVDFIMVRADASRTDEPVFELWRLSPAGSATRTRRLPREMYLAGIDHGSLLWNTPEPSGTFLITHRASDGASVQIGCGAVLVDPVDAVDPDLRRGRGSLVPPRGDWLGLEHGSGADDSPAVPELAVIVGDFADRTAAEGVVARIREVYPGSVVDVVDATSAPLAIRPGVFGALLRLPTDADATQALTVFRQRLPEYASQSWVVTP
jgi:hypothetical protein